MVTNPPSQPTRSPPGDPAPASDIRAGYTHLRRIYCAQRDGELLALALEVMALPELIEVAGKLSRRGAHTETAELLTWIRQHGLGRGGAT